MHVASRKQLKLLGIFNLAINYVVFFLLAALFEKILKQQFHESVDIIFAN